MRHQQPDGRWTEMRCCSGRSDPDDVALTAQALRAFTAADLGPDSPDVIANRRVGPAIRDALHWLTQQQEPDGRIGASVLSQATVLRALGEVLARRRTPLVADACARSVDWLLHQQGYAGLWSDAGDSPSRAADVSVHATVAALLALHAARAGGVEVPAGVVRTGVDALTREAGGREWVEPFPWACAKREWWSDFVGFDVALASVLSGGASLRQDYFEGWRPEWESGNLCHRAWLPAVAYAVEAGAPRARAFMAALTGILAREQERDACSRGSWRVSYGGSGATTEATAAYALCLSLLARSRK